MRHLNSIIVLVFSFCFASAQTETSSIGTGLEMYYSVNGHGSFISPHISYAAKRHSLKLGPCIHKRTTQVKGAKLTYAFLLAGMDGEEQTKTNFSESSNGTWRVSIFAYGQFVDYTALSYKREVEETLLNTDANSDWSRVYLSTAEGGLGAEIDVKLFKYFQFRTYVGIAVYSHLNAPEYMYQDKTAAAFIAGIGVNVPSFKRAEKK